LDWERGRSGQVAEGGMELEEAEGWATVDLG